MGVRYHLPMTTTTAGETYIIRDSADWTIIGYATIHADGYHCGFQANREDLDAKYDEIRRYGGLGIVDWRGYEFSTLDRMVEHFQEVAPDLGPLYVARYAAR